MPHSSLTPVCFCFLAKIVGDLVEPRRALGESLAFGPHVGVVEAVVGDAEQREHLEGDVGLQLGLFHRVAEPWPLEGLAAERIAARPGEGMPVGDGEAQMIFQPLAGNDLVLGL